MKHDPLTALLGKCAQQKQDFVRFRFKKIEPLGVHGWIDKLSNPLKIIQLGLNFPHTFRDGFGVDG